jgi:hypothetical protein
VEHILSPKIVCSLTRLHIMEERVLGVHFISTTELRVIQKSLLKVL